MIEMNGLFSRDYGIYGLDNWKITIGLATAFLIIMFILWKINKRIW